MTAPDLTLPADELKRLASAYHARGFNCAQSVICAFAPRLGLDGDTAFRLAEGFGLGMGGMTETCGALSGAVMVLSQIASAGMDDPTSKGRTYQLAREATRRFRDQNGSTLCGDLKGIGGDAGPLRRCPECIADAVDIAIEIIGEL